MKRIHYYDENYGIVLAAPLLAQCKKCHELYQCEENSKSHIIELLDKNFKRYKFVDSDIIK